MNEMELIVMNEKSKIMYKLKATYLYEMEKQKLIDEYNNTKVNSPQSIVNSKLDKLQQNIDDLNGNYNQLANFTILTLPTPKKDLYQWNDEEYKKVNTPSFLLFALWFLIFLALFFFGIYILHITDDDTVDKLIIFSIVIASLGTYFFSKSYRKAKYQKNLTKKNKPIVTKNDQIQIQNEKYNQDDRKKERLIHEGSQKLIPAIKNIEEQYTLLNNNREDMIKQATAEYNNKLTSLKQAIADLDIKYANKYPQDLFPTKRLHDLDYYLFLEELIRTEQATSIGEANKIAEDRYQRQELATELVKTLNKNRDAIINQIQASTDKLNKTIKESAQAITERLKSINGEITLAVQYLASIEENSKQLTSQLNTLETQVQQQTIQQNTYLDEAADIYRNFNNHLSNIQSITNNIEYNMQHSWIA